MGHRPATSPDVSATPQAGVRHRDRDLPALRRPAARHRQQRGAPRHRADSRAPRPRRRCRPSDPRTAPARSVALTVSAPRPATAPRRARLGLRPRPPVRAGICSSKAKSPTPERRGTGPGSRRMTCSTEPPTRHPPGRQPAPPDSPTHIRPLYALSAAVIRLSVGQRLGGCRGRCQADGQQGDECFHGRIPPWKPGMPHCEKLGPGRARTPYGETASAARTPRFSAVRTANLTQVNPRSCGATNVAAPVLFPLPAPQSRLRRRRP